MVLMKTAGGGGVKNREKNICICKYEKAGKLTRGGRVLGKGKKEMG